MISVLSPYAVRRAGRLLRIPGGGVVAFGLGGGLLQDGEQLGGFFGD
jgi:hypothetical protein